jgi:hypothetical protein
MAAKFTRGDSIETTRNTTQKSQMRDEPVTRSARQSEGTPKRRNTMNGMPGYVDTGAGSDGAKALRGGRTVAPRGPPGAPGAGPGTGRSIGHRGGGAEVKKAERGGTGTMGSRKDWFGGGHRGRMERLKGSARSFGEKGGRKSTMY